MTSKAKATTVTLSAAEFRADPGAAYIQARTVERVIVQNDRGEPRLVISQQQERLDRRR